MRLEPRNRQEQEAGARHHARETVAERFAGGSIGLGWVLVVLAVLGLLLWWVLAR